MVSLEKQANSYSRSLSGGMKRRLLIAKAMVHQPPVLILDEPTAGVDVDLRKNLWSNVKELNKEGVTIILTTHYLFEAQEMCDRIAIIDNGNIVINDTTENLTEKNGNSQIVIECDNIAQENIIKDFDYVINNKQIIINTESPNKMLPKIMEQLKKINITIQNIEIKKNTLEQVFLKLTNNNNASIK